MATFKACVKAKRKDGFYPVYIRVIHHKKVAYIPTDKMVNDKGLSKSGEIEDPYVMQFCTNRIVEYMEVLNRVDTELWTVKDITDYLKSGYNDICFSDYARKHIDRMIDKGEQRNARNYELALQHMERFAGTTKVMFSHLTSNFVNRWIESLAQTHRAKEMYPICMRQVFKAAQVEMNDYDNGIIRIKTNPWVKVKIPKADRTEKLAITPEACREFFSFPLPDSKMKYPLMELGRDVAMMVLPCRHQHGGPVQPAQGGLPRRHHTLPACQDKEVQGGRCVHGDARAAYPVAAVREVRQQGRSR